jgi:lactate racemase
MAFGKGLDDGLLPDGEARDLVANALGNDDYDGKRVLLITPDLSRSCPMGLTFRAIHDAVGDRVATLDVLIALGTHPPLTDEQIEKRFEMTREERAGRFAAVDFYNHAWKDPEQLHTLGVIPAAEIDAVTGGLFSMDVEITINKMILDYDLLLIAGPVFPHEVVGYSGGNKYFFPGIAGPAIIDFFHWLGAVITNPKIIGTKKTPVRAVPDRAAALIPAARRCLAMVVKGADLAGLYYGEPEDAWSDAADLSSRLHVIYKDKPYHTVLSCAPEMYDELWTGGKCMYKLEPVVADGGELIIYAPHIEEIAVAHGKIIEEIGYHTRDYFLAQWDRFQGYPWGVVAHSTHVRGIGSYAEGKENPRVTVTLATGIPEETCRRINLGYRDPAGIDPQDYADREDEGILLVPHAGEQLYKLKDPPAWQRFDA